MHSPLHMSDLLTAVERNLDTNTAPYPYQTKTSNSSTPSSEHLARDHHKRRSAHSIQRYKTPKMPGSLAASSSRIIVVGVGGATCSGKTTLAKHLLQILNQTPNSSSDDGEAKKVTGHGIKDAFILHQDDFAPPEASLPVNKEFGVTDWDHPPTAVSRTV